jgi:type I restriction enzyme S subunit
MNRWPTKMLGEICAINPKLTASEAPAADAQVTFVSMSAVDEITASIARPELREYSQVAKGYTPFRENDVLFAKITPCMQNGKAAIARGLRDGLGFGSTEFHVLRPSESVLPKWVLAFLRQPSFRSVAEANFTGSAGQQRVPTDFLKKFPIPVPPIVEQERIVTLLDEADALRKLRAQADRRTADLIPALFHEMFGDPTINRLHLPMKELGVVCNVVGGGTPSKKNPAYWTGKTPWVSPKDMLGDEIHNSEDHISEQALKESTTNLIPAGSILVVTRSGILKHTLPVAVNSVPVTINQDIKAFVPKGECDPQFLAAQLRLLAPNILGTVRVGATVQNLETDALKRFPVLLPTLMSQNIFAQRVAEIREMESLQATSSARLNDLFKSALHRAFQGGL